MWASLNALHFQTTVMCIIKGETKLHFISEFLCGTIDHQNYQPLWCAWLIFDNTHLRFILFLYMCYYCMCKPVYENKFRGLRRCVKSFSLHSIQLLMTTLRTTLLLQHENILHISYLIFAIIHNVYLFYWLNVRENARIVTTFEFILYVMYKFKSTKNVFCI